MIVSFNSLDEELNKVSFVSKAKRINDIIVFEDKSVNDTMINLKIRNNSIIIDRSGHVNLYMEFKENNIFKTKYKSNDGLEFDFEIFCNMLDIKQNRIDIEYDMILDDFTKTHHKIWVLMK